MSALDLLLALKIGPLELKSQFGNGRLEQGHLLIRLPPGGLNGILRPDLTFLQFRAQFNDGALQIAHFRQRLPPGNNFRDLPGHLDHLSLWKIGCIYSVER